jgi:hypothetical protein
MPLTSHDEMLVGVDHGRICALATAGQRDLQNRATAHPELFAANPFDPALFGTIALATAFGAPECTVEQLQVANRMALWVFAVDWLVDYAAKSRKEVEDIVASCLAVAGGAAPTATDPLAHFLAEIRDDLAAAPGFPTYRLLWREEVERMLTAMAREWEWKAVDTAGAAGGAGPTVDEYLDNSDNTGLVLVHVSHWLYTGDRECLERLDQLITAGRAAQRVLRLVNDLATVHRDEEWGDLNAIMLIGDRAEVSRQVTVLAERCLELLRPLELTCPQQAGYLARQLGFTTGFYKITDFWGGL